VGDGQKPVGYGLDFENIQDAQGVDGDSSGKGLPANKMPNHGEDNDCMN
jgi:hypothetical protein